MAGKKEIPGRLLRVMGGDWLDNKLAAVPDNRATVRCEIETSGAMNTIECKWRKLPEWLKEALLTPFPVCSCKRRRVNTAENADGYSRCAFCRNEETCSSCGATRVRVTLVGGKGYCPTCLPNAAAVTTAVLNANVAQAVCAQAMELGGMQHCTEFPEGGGWDHYYVASNGDVWGSHLSPEALIILKSLPVAQGKGQHMLLAWIVGGPFRGGRDFFTQTQVKGKNIPLPPAHTPFSDLHLAVWIYNINRRD